MLLKKLSFLKWIKYADKISIIFNDNKTKYIILYGRDVNYQCYDIIEGQNHSFKEVSLFKNLGTLSA